MSWIRHIRVLCCVLVLSSIGAFSEPANSMAIGFWVPQDGRETTGETESAEEQESAEADEDAKTITVRGQLVLADAASGFSIKGMPVVLDEFPKPPALPLPDNYMDLSLEQRQEWYGKFIESEAGIAYQKAVAAAEEKRQLLETQADDAGRFVFREVQRSQFALYGQQEFKKDGKTYLAEFQAEFAVQDKVKFIELDRLPVLIKRLPQVGEVAPDLRLRAEAGKDSVVSLKSFDKPVLLYFWTVGSVKLLQAELEKVDTEELGITILGVNLNAPGEELDSYLAEATLPWKTLKTDGLESSPVAIDFAVSHLPAMWLIGADGKVKATDMQFYRALSTEEADLIETLKQVLAGKTIGEEEPESDDQ